mgnify:CR=1 FL=1
MALEPFQLSSTELVSPQTVFTNKTNNTHTITIICYFARLSTAVLRLSLCLAPLHQYKLFIAVHNSLYAPVTTNAKPHSFYYVLITLYICLRLVLSKFFCYLHGGGFFSHPNTNYIITKWLWHKLFLVLMVKTFYLILYK